jgi:hypothetical protein
VRQLLFLETLARTRSVTKAAASAGMSRESAYRLRDRLHAALFAAAWDRALGADRSLLTRAQIDQGHIRAIADACGPERSRLRLPQRNRQFRDPS